MKKLIILILFIPSICLGQDYFIAADEITIIKNTFNINYYNKKFSDNYFRTNTLNSANVLMARQRNYEINFNAVQDAYGKVYYQSFITDHNNKKIKKWLNEKVEPNIKKIEAKNIDWSVNRKYAEYWRNYFLKIYDNQSVKSELQLLKEINSELLRLKAEYPGRFHKTERYKEIFDAINELKRIGKSECVMGEDDRVCENFQYRYSLRISNKASAGDGVVRNRIETLAAKYGLISLF